MFTDTCPHVLINGEIVPVDQATVSLFDRGYLFADGVYEGISVYKGCCVDNQPHMDRLLRSLAAVKIQPDFDIEQIRQWQQRLIAANGLDEGFLYLQITRGVASRDFPFPQLARAQISMFAKPVLLVDNPNVERGVKVCVVDDVRWKRRDIKSIGLLPQAMAKEQAVQAGCFEAWMQEDGYITEGSSTSAFIVSDGVLITRPLSQAILPGVTRAAVLRLAQKRGIPVQERLFTADEAYRAQEAFLTSASNLVVAITHIDGHILADGVPGPTTKQLRQLYIDTFMGW